MASGAEPPPPFLDGKGDRTAVTVRRVAVVDDEIMVAWSIESMLEDSGYEVVGVYSSGEEALAALAVEPVDLVCMDINLGRGMDGIETAGRICAKQPAAIVFISAYSDPATTMRAREAVPDATILGKPITLDGLEQALRAVSERPN